MLDRKPVQNRVLGPLVLFPLLEKVDETINQRH